MATANEERSVFASVISTLFLIVALAGIGAALVGAYLFFPGTNHVPAP